MPKPTDDLQKLRQMLEGIQVAMLTTHDEQGHLRSRPMATRELDEEGNLWFFTAKSSSKVPEIHQDQQVNLAYVDADDDRYVSVCGRAEVVDDAQKEQALWSPLLTAWFPQGLLDPELLLIRVAVEKVEYWDSPHAQSAQLLGANKAALTGERAQGAHYEQLRPGQG